ncbi:hypothetical protein HHK02_06525 [Limosilactobacillus reuteri]|uniref:Glycosyltransferase RgtA/B/C/D-like domain-containing protein n=1 Tax=Limosilactobacillus reuteri TaxID=1598 RepID=A0A7L6BGQ5_LIMRT|nr:DUF6020 family protein [Limosilactobacillus reuteri]QLQ60889.1 hypothetical protein HHK02_06525 [Limosilactobacillus reuteri]UFK64907.1 hypothetical protein IU404_00255 [Limosilactobacillus reuteri]UFK67654.1 hypothetical protein IVR12_00660 [Limosilactobacillus reuteri]HIS89066.1 hypothetical protein [Candidatus Avigastranaerophilus faecigallinarum]
MIEENRKSLYKLLAFILSFEAVVFFQYLIKDPNQGLSYTNSWSSVLLFVVIYKLYSSTDFLKNSRRSIFVLLCLATIYSILLVIGVNLYRYNNVNFMSLKTWIKVIGNLPLLFVIVNYIYLSLPQLNSIFSTNNALQRFFNCRETWKLLWFGMIIFWLIELFATYPGNYAYDAGYQLQSYLNTREIYLHHPLAHTELLIFFVLKIGRNILGGETQGLFIYTFLQILWLSFAYSRVLEYLRKINLNYAIRICFFVIFCLSPYIGIMSISVTKNVPYTASFIILVLWYLERKNWLLKFGKLKYWTIFVLFALINLIFENQGVYVITLSLVFAFLFQKSIRKELLLSCIAILFGTVIYNGPVTRSLNGHIDKEDRVRESLSIPIMQLSSVASQKNLDITSDEVNQVRIYIPNYKMYESQNCQSLSDPLKSSFNSDQYIKNKQNFWKLWFKLAKQNPNEYLNAFAKMTIGYWYPDTSYPDRRSYYKYFLEYSSYVKQEHKNEKAWHHERVATPKALKPLYKFYTNFVNSYPNQRIPVISMIDSIGFNVFILLFFTAWMIIFKERKYIFLIVLTLSLLGTFLLGPVVLYRYAFPIVSVVPLCVGIMISESQKMMEGRA